MMLRHGRPATTRLAAVDIGSNSVKLLVADARPDGLHTVKFLRETTRMGDGMERNGRISAVSLRIAARVVRDFCVAAKNAGARDPVVFATHAVRTAHNADSVISALSRAAGTGVRVMTGRREARLAALGACAAVGRTRRHALVFDIGGGSVEFARMRGGRIVRTASRPLGALVLTRRFLTVDPPTRTAIDRLDRYVGEMVRRVVTSVIRADSAPDARPGATARPAPGGWDLIASGGAATVAATMCGVRPGRDARPLRRGELRQLSEQAGRLPLNQRRRMPGLPADRAEIILPGLLVALRVIDALGKRSTRVSPGGVREGVLIELAKNIR